MQQAGNVNSSRDVARYRFAHSVSAQVEVPQVCTSDAELKPEGRPPPRVLNGVVGVAVSQLLKSGPAELRMTLRIGTRLGRGLTAVQQAEF